MKVSELGKEEMCYFGKMNMAYLTEEDNAILDIAKSASIAYASDYTGIPIVELDEYEDITIAVLVLITDMFYNREMSVDKSNVNRVTSSILGLHARNLIG